MKNLLFFLTILVFITSAGQVLAQEKAKNKKLRPDNDSLFIFNRHKAIFYLGYGVGTINNNYISPYGFQANGSTQIGPVYFKFERALNPRIGISINTFLQYDTWNSSLEDDKPAIPITYTRTYKRFSYGILARFNYHAKVNRKIDGYIGGGIGWKNEKWQRTANIATYNYSDDPPKVNQLALEATAGIRYLLAPHWLLFVEAGYSKSVLQAGLSFNIPKP